MAAAHRPDYIEFVARIRHARQAKRLSQLALGKLLGKPQSFVSKVETCERRLDLVEAADWCIALSIKLDEALPERLREAMAKVREQ